MLVLYYFYLELSASKTRDELEMDYGVVHRKFMQFRKSIADYCNAEAKRLNGELELDESYFGAKRIGKQKAACATARKICCIIYAMLKKNQEFRYS